MSEISQQVCDHPFALFHYDNDNIVIGKSLTYSYKKEVIIPTINLDKVGLSIVDSEIGIYTSKVRYIFNKNNLPRIDYKNPKSLYKENKLYNIVEKLYYINNEDSIKNTLCKEQHVYGHF